MFSPPFYFYVGELGRRLMESFPMNPASDLENTVRAVVAHQTPGKLARGAAILANYRWTQIGRRVFRLLSQRLRPSRTVGDWPEAAGARLRPVSPRVEALARLVVDARVGWIATQDSDLSSGRLVIMGETLDVGRPMCWRELAAEQALSHLLRFQLQYQEFLLGQLAKDGTAAWPLIWEALSSWLVSFPPLATRRTTDAWHPYCISRRIPVWCWLLTLGNPSPELRDRLTQSLASQAEYLSGHLEIELGGNHLLENVAALAMAAGFVDHERAGHWLERAWRVWQCERAEQILAHGEHFERSPMYHCQVAANLLKQSIVVAELDDDIAKEWKQTGLAMVNFVRQIEHPDGEIPLLSDSGWEEAPSLAELQQIADLAESCGESPVIRNKSRSTITHHASSLRSRTVGPYWIARWNTGGRPSMVLVDGGEVGPRHLPAHAHADLSNLEISIAGQRWIVDSGNFQYAAGSMRDYCRSSLAHNVLTVGNSNSCEIWGSFRMGHRGRIVEFRSGSTAGCQWVVVAHDGYRKVGVSRVTRLLGVDEFGSIYVADRVEGKPSRPVVGGVHCHPSVRILFPDSEPASLWKLEQDGCEQWLAFLGATRVARASGWYCPRFGCRERNEAFLYEGSDESGQIIGWILSPMRPEFEEFPTWILEQLGR